VGLYEQNNLNVDFPPGDGIQKKNILQILVRNKFIDINVIRYFVVEKGANLKCWNYAGLALSNASLEILYLLIDSGAKIENNLLQIAMDTHPELPLAKYLVSKGAFNHFKVKEEIETLQKTLMKPKVPFEVIEYFLVELGMKFNSHNYL
jgi:hypothetical protein